MWRVEIGNDTAGPPVGRTIAIPRPRTVRIATDGRTAFNLIQNATDTGQGALVFFLFDLLHLEGEDLTSLPLVDRKTRLASLLNGAPNSLRYNDQIGHGPAFHRLAC